MNQQIAQTRHSPGQHQKQGGDDVYGVPGREEVAGPDYEGKQERYGYPKPEEEEVPGFAARQAQSEQGHEENEEYSTPAGVALKDLLEEL